MLTFIELERIENAALNDYLSDLNITDDIIYDTMPYWYDADSYVDINGKCNLPGDVVKEWIATDINDVIDRYLLSNNVKSIDELASPDDISTAESYYDFCYGLFETDIESLWHEIKYQDRVDAYFEEHAQPYSYDDYLADTGEW